MEKKQAVSLLLISVILIIGIFSFSIQQSPSYTGFGIFDKLLTKFKSKEIKIDKLPEIESSRRLPMINKSSIFATRNTENKIKTTNKRITFNAQGTTYIFNNFIDSFCKNGKKDSRETGVDCGGSCKPCNNDQPCITSNDCLSNVCKNICTTEKNSRGETVEGCTKQCTAPTCNDGIKNQKETGVDCGGPCKPCVRCRDTDPRDDVYVLGQATDQISGRQITDACIDDSTIKQVVCGIKDNPSYGESIRCPDGTACVAGVCASIDTLGCLDTDPTNNIYLQGNVIDRTNTQGVDHCGENPHVVIQGFCNRELLGWRNTNCPSGERCENGICRPEPNLCQVPNPEQYVPDGTVFDDQGNPHIDYCADEHTVTHVTCNSGNELTSQTPCPDETTCNRGLCLDRNGNDAVGEHECIDTDPYDNIYIQGVVSLGNEYRWDNCDCDDPTIVNQKSCSSRGTILYRDTECPEGFSCFFGICQEINNCVDTDPENNPYIKGEKTQAGITESDQCNYFDRLVLSQYECGSSCNSYEQCPDGTYCNDGACVRGQPECTDTDGGGNNEVFVYGEILLNGEYRRYADYCITETLLSEMGCDGFNLREENIQREGYYCSNGRLVNCIDTDESNVQIDLGYVTDSSGTQHSDYCVGEQLVQLDCRSDGTRIARSVENCNPIYYINQRQNDDSVRDVYVKYNAGCSSGTCQPDFSSYTELTREEYDNRPQ